MGNIDKAASRLPVVSGATDKVARKLGQAILDFLGEIPSTDKKPASNPETEARRIAKSAAAKAALTSGSLALPSGPLGVLTLVPDLIAVWKIQAQMVSDIAAVFGKQASMTREQMIFCLFRHLAAQALRDIAVRTGERVLVRRASLAVMQVTAHKIGIELTQKIIGKSIARWIPIAGAIGVGTYAYFDTHQVATTAIELFKQADAADGPMKEAIVQAP